MGRVITAYLLNSEPVFQSNDGGNPPNALKITDAAGTQTTLNTNEFPVRVTINGEMQRIASITYWDDLYIGDSARGNSYRILHVWLRGGNEGSSYISPTAVVGEGGQSDPLGFTYYDFVGGNLKGKTLYIFDTNAGGTAWHHGRWQLNINTHYIINAPTNVVAPSTANGIITLTWTPGAVNDGVLSYYAVIYRDRANSSAAWSDWSWNDVRTSTTTSIQISPNNVPNGQRQYAVRAIGTNDAYSSEWGFSGVCTSQRPVVGIGDVITKAQWDQLKTWRQMQGMTNITSATTGEKITATIGNTYT